KERFQSLVQPTRSLTPEVRQLTGLEEESLRGAPARDEVLPRFLDFVADSAVVAHNGLAYDFPLLAAACAAAGLEPPTGLRLDTLELAHVVFPRAGEGLLPNSDGTRPPTGRGLDALAHHFGIPMSDQRHRALDDVELTLSILRRM